MKVLLSTFLFLISVQTFAQFDYDHYINLTTSESLLQNMKFSSITEFQSEKKGNKTKLSEQQFLKDGFPSTITQFDQQGQIAEKKEFIYEQPTNRIKSIETYKNNKLQSSTEFELNHSGQILSYTDYVYSSLDGKKLFVWKTFLDYNLNGTLKKTIKLEGDNKDTTEIVFYNGYGIKTKELWNEGGIRAKKIEYTYNNDSTEMLQKEYENDTTIFNTVIHKYKDKKEIERIDPATSNRPFYWRYDKFGRVIETNESFYYVLYFDYNSDGSLKKKTIKILFTDSNENDLPKKIRK
jgi:hypothetical protein